MSALGRMERGSALEEILQPPVVLRPAPHPPKRVGRMLMFVADALTLLAAAALGTAAYFGALFRPVAFAGQLEPAVVFACEIVLAWLPFLVVSGIYAPGLSWGSGEFSKAVRAVAEGSAVHVLARFALGAPMAPRLWSLGVWVLATIALVAERLIVRRISSRMHMRGDLLRRTLVVGTNSEAAGVVHALSSRRHDGFSPVGCLASSLKDRLSLDYTAPVVPTLGNARELLRVIYEHDVQVVIVVASAFDHEVLERIISELSEADVDVYLSSSLADVLLSRVTIREVAGIPLIALRGISLSPANLLLKRTFDLIGAVCVIALGMPLWLILAALIKLTSRGPVFYVQERIGLRGKPFGMYKFRSMVDGAESKLAEVRAASGMDDGPLFKLPSDPRVTAVGKWMRRFSLDEFPQLINVVRGEMSMVGPRPPLLAETMYYGDYEWRRLEVVPGMTGLWQVSGRSDLTFDEMVSLDLFYIGNWTLALDLSILARTIPAVVGAKGAW